MRFSIFSYDRKKPKNAFEFILCGCCLEFLLGIYLLLWEHLKIFRTFKSQVSRKMSNILTILLIVVEYTA
jgi:hypothetical protein